MKTKIFISLFILYFLGACSSPESSIKPNPDIYITLRIRGTITDATDNSPVIADVALHVMFGIWAAEKCDVKGQYTIESKVHWVWDLTDALVWLEVFANGYKYKSVTSKDENHVRLTEEWQTIDVQLEHESGGLR